MSRETLESKVNNFEQEIRDTINGTKKGLFGLNLSIIGEKFKNKLNKLKKFFGFSTDDENNNESENTTIATRQAIQTETQEHESNSSTVSEAMLQQLLHMEGTQKFTATIHGKKFGETFVTGPYGMVYKHIDTNGNLLKTPTTFTDGEQVSQSWAEKNARAYYNKKAKQWKDVLDQHGCKYTQNMLDALVSASGGTVASYNTLKNFVTSHWNDKNTIYNFWINFATKAAGNGKVMPGLVRRRKFEANRFKGIEKPFSSYSA